MTQVALVTGVTGQDGAYLAELLLHHVPQHQTRAHHPEVEMTLHPIVNMAETIQSVVGYQRQIVFDPSKPDGTPRKLMDVSLLSKVEWSAKVTLKNGLQHVVAACIDLNNSLKSAPQ